MPRAQMHARAHDAYRCRCTSVASVTEAVSSVAARSHSSEPRATSTSMQVSLWGGHVSGNGYLRHANRRG